MRPLCSLLVLGIAAGCGTLLDVADDPPPATPLPNGDGGADAESSKDAAALPDGSPIDGAPEASCGDTSSDPANCGSCGRKCNVGGTCKAGKCDRFVVFVTSTAMNGAFTLVAADGECAARAQAGSLGGTFRAWMPSPGATPNRFAPPVLAPYYRTNGDQVAPQWPPGSTLSLPISYDEKGVARPSALVWSELDGNGDVTGINDCLGWVNPAANQQGGYGRASATDGTWTQPVSASDVQSCDQSLAFYCVERP